MPIPSFPGPTTLLVDVSHNQPNANLAAAQASGIAGVMLKATEGATYTDPAFLNLFRRAQAAGLLIGAYHFGTARAALDQLANYINTVTTIAGGFGNVVAVLDLEHNDPTPDNTMSLDLGEEWVAGFKARTGRTPMIYAGAYLRDNGAATGRPNLASCPLWLAQYDSSPEVIPGWADWTLWQFTDGATGPFAGTVAGIGRCDQNIFRGTPNDLAAFWTSMTAAPAV
jgi:lysozyme